jgi:hypothetical protein
LALSPNAPNAFGDTGGAPPRPALGADAANRGGKAGGGAVGGLVCRGEEPGGWVCCGGEPPGPAPPPPAPC